MFLEEVLREKNTLPRVSHFSFLEQPRVTIFVYISFEFKYILKNQPARGSFTARIEVLRAFHHIFHFVSLTLIPLLISLLIIVDISIILTDLSFVMSS